MKRGDILRVHPSMVPKAEQVCFLFVQSTGETWVGVKHSDDEVLLVRRFGHDVTPAGIATDPRFDDAV